MITEILPPAVVAEEAFADPPGATLFPEEEALLTRAVAKRRQEFTTVRHCARAALRRLGVPPGPILPGERGAPRWPAGVVGSMTHCAGYRAAALARHTDVASVGIDAEPHEPLPDGVLGAVTSDGERAMLGRLAAAAPGVCWDRLVFCAKEAVYKTWYPLTGRWLDFAEAEVDIDPVTATFAARLLVPGPVVAGREWREFPGRYLVRDGLMLATITLPA
ncbi:4'-phosphopantetheinyl transferase superfamily protein [Actinomycetes bacterium KLBMP 9797]